MEVDIFNRKEKIKRKEKNGKRRYLKQRIFTYFVRASVIVQMT